jgi:hypothetical protein
MKTRFKHFFIEALMDKDFEVRIYAEEALKKIGGGK